MARTISLENGVYVDVSSVTHIPFTGVIPSGLDVGDSFETVNENGVKSVCKVTNKSVTKEGAVIIQSKEV